MNASPASRTIASPRTLVLLVLPLSLVAGGALVPSRAGASYFPKCSRVLSRYSPDPRPSTSTTFFGPSEPAAVMRQRTDFFAATCRRGRRYLRVYDKLH